jgi:hypothetical protein
MNLLNIWKIRIENMRKLQNEEHQKILVAHQTQMHQLKLQQVTIHYSSKISIFYY